MFFFYFEFKLNIINIYKINVFKIISHTVYRTVLFIHDGTNYLCTKQFKKNEVFNYTVKP